MKRYRYSSLQLEVAPVLTGRRTRSRTSNLIMPGFLPLYEGYAVATPELQIELAAVAWDVKVTVKILQAGVVRLAKAGECQVLLEDLGEGLDLSVWNSSDWKDTAADGTVLLTNATYSWITGFEPAIWNSFSTNRFKVTARLKATPSIYVILYLFLSTTDWSTKTTP